MKGGIGWKLITLALDRDPWKLYLMFLSREIDLQNMGISNIKQKIAQKLMKLDVKGTVKEKWKGV